MIRPGEWEICKVDGEGIFHCPLKQNYLHLRKSILPSFESASTLPTLLKLRMAPGRKLRMSND